MSECEDCYADLHCDNCPCCESAPKAWRYPCYCLPGAARCDDPTACDRSIQESAGCELRPALIEDVKTALDAAYHYSSYRWPQQQDCHRIADDLLAGAALRDVLAAAACDAELREAVISLAVRFETFGEVLHSVPTAEAYTDAGASLREALDVP